MSTLNVDKVDPNTGTALEIGSSGDTVTIPSGATLTLTSATLNLPTTITSTTEVKTNKVSPATGTAFALGDSGDTFTVPSGATIVNSGTATGFGITAASFLPNANPIMINGDMAVSQRSTSVASISSGGLAYSTVDRIGYWIGTAGTWTQTQETLTSGNAYDAGFKKALKWDCTTANASLSAGSYLMTSLPLEGNSLQAFKKGTSNAEVMTLAFWVKATKTGTNIIELYDADNTRQISASYTVSSTNTWEHKIVTFAADTSADPWADDTGKSLEIYFWWVAGTNYTSGSLNTSWADAPAAATRAVGQVNNADSTSNNIHLTGIQIEVGTYTSSTIPPFQFESYGDNLARCQRYYYLHAANTSSGDVGVGGYYSSSYIFFNITFPCSMRIAPSLVYVSGTDYYKIIGLSTTDYFNDILGGGSVTTNEINFYNNSQVSGTEGGAGWVRTNNTSASIALNAEL